MWRNASPLDENEIVQMSLALYEEDPAGGPVAEAQVRRTLSTLRAEPVRGQALVLELAGTIAGYALLISFWSNELGGEVCVIDELFVKPRHRGQGFARGLLQSLAGESPLWPRQTVALELEVTPRNTRAAAFYVKLGFIPAKNTRMRFLRRTA
jgi:GNAT superfamily N-acetyltransferase